MELHSSAYVRIIMTCSQFLASTGTILPERQTSLFGVCAQTATDYGRSQRFAEVTLFCKSRNVMFRK